MRMSWLLKCKKLAEGLWVKEFLFFKKDIQEKTCPSFPLNLVMSGGWDAWSMVTTWWSWERLLWWAHQRGCRERDPEFLIFKWTAAIVQSWSCPPPILLFDIKIFLNLLSCWVKVFLWLLIERILTDGIDPSDSSWQLCPFFEGCALFTQFFCLWPSPWILVSHAQSLSLLQRHVLWRMYYMKGKFVLHCGTAAHGCAGSGVCAEY